MHTACMYIPRNTITENGRQAVSGPNYPVHAVHPLIMPTSSVGEGVMQGTCKNQKSNTVVVPCRAVDRTISETDTRSRGLSTADSRTLGLIGDKSQSVAGEWYETAVAFGLAGVCVYHIVH
jgi:hypothetical protein